MKVPMALVGDRHLLSAKNALVQLACIFIFAGLVNCATWTSFQSVSLSRPFSLICTDTLYIDQRPDIRAPVLNISIKNDSFISPGYIFLTPYDGEAPGPYIYDYNGVSSLSISLVLSTSDMQRILYGAGAMAQLRSFLIISMFALMTDQIISATSKEPCWVGMRGANMRL